MKCRLLARKFVLENSDISHDLKKSLNDLLREINSSLDKDAPPENSLCQAALQFHETMLDQIANSNKEDRRSIVLHACDILR